MPGFEPGSSQYKADSIPMCYRASVYVDHVCEHDATKFFFIKLKQINSQNWTDPYFFKEGICNWFYSRLKVFTLFIETETISRLKSK